MTESRVCCPLSGTQAGEISAVRGRVSSTQRSRFFCSPRDSTSFIGEWGESATELDNRRNMDKGPCAGTYPCPPFEFQSLVCHYFGRFPCRCRNFDKTSIACRHFVALVSLFQGRIACRGNLPLTGPWTRVGWCAVFQERPYWTTPADWLYLY